MVKGSQGQTDSLEIKGGGGYGKASLWVSYLKQTFDQLTEERIF